MARDPLFWVLVRNYRLLATNSLVQSPHVDLKAHGPPVIVREISGEYMEEPHAVDDITLLGDDINRKHYRHAAHGVCISRRSHVGNFPVWVCLKRNLHCQEYHLCVLNLYSFKFLVVPISSICWVPSHEATNGELYTIIGSPGRHGYKETRLPSIKQKLGYPEQAIYAVPPSSLPGLTKLEPRRQQELFSRQYMNIKQGYRTCSKPTQPSLHERKQRRRPYSASSPELPDFCRDGYLASDEESTSHLVQAPIYEDWDQVPEGSCRCPCPHSDLGPTCSNPYPLHRHVTDSQCDLGSSHQTHCIFGDHRPEHCVISDPRYCHEHCVVSGIRLSIDGPTIVNVEHYAAGSKTDMNNIATSETETESGSEAGFKSLPDELERLTGQSCFRDSDKVLKDRDQQTWGTPAMPTSSLESRQTSPIEDFLLTTPEDLEGLDNLPDPALNIVTIQGTLVLDYDALITTPEPPEIPR
ncbi:hypothetical protein F5Y07DRAFT_176481 [Xylaria sp. FL0933]|nr:hypothetical protein F5Y07DRAFT_176481 [Xylaria sp. FL0933]